MLDITKLPKSIPESHEIIRLQNSLLVEQQEKYDRLLEQIKILKQQRFSHSSEKNILQLDLFNEAGIDLETIKDPTENTESVTVVAHQRKKKSARRPLPEDLPRERQVYDLEDKLCHCGHPLKKFGETISEQLKVIPAQVSVIQHVRPKYTCSQCESVKTAKMPLLLLPKSIATPDLMTHIIISKYCDHLPLYRQETMWKRQGIDLSRSTLCQLLMKVAHLCEPVFELLKRLLLSYDYVQADETPTKVLPAKGEEGSRRGYMWCYRGGDKGNIILYEYQETRAGYHAEAFLTGFEGYLQSDAYSGYNWAKTAKNIVSVGCHAHARRPFAQLVKITNIRGLAHEVVKFYQQLYKTEKTARENQLSPEQRYDLRLREAKPILGKLYAWLMKYKLQSSPKSQLGKGIRYCLNHWDTLMAYLKDGRIEIDNNLIENAIRPFAIGRKNWLFMGSAEGAKAGAIFYSLIETCKANQINVQKYFLTMLHQLPNCKSDDDYLKLLPQNIQIPP